MSDPPSDAPIADGAVCASCGAALAGPYCHACGEKRLDRHDYALAHVVEHGIDAFTHVDVKVLRSLWSLFRRPGQMASDLLAGRRVAWARPFQLFIVANVLYYLLASFLHLNTFQTPLRYQISATWYGGLAADLAANKAAHLGISADAFAERFDAVAHTLSKSLLITLVPPIAALLMALTAGRRRYFLEHLTVALVLLPAILLLMPLPYPVVPLLMRGGGLVSGDGVWTFLTVALFSTYGAIFFRRVYGGTWVAAVARGLGLAVGFYLIVIYVYRPILFVATQILTR